MKAKDLKPGMMINPNPYASSVKFYRVESVEEFGRLVFIRISQSRAADGLLTRYLDQEIITSSEHGDQNHADGL